MISIVFWFSNGFEYFLCLGINPAGNRCTNTIQQNMGPAALYHASQPVGARPLEHKSTYEPPKENDKMQIMLLIDLIEY